MVGDLPSDFGEGSTTRPPAGQWPPTQAIPTPARSRTWPAVALAATAMVVAVAALIVALTNSRPAASPATTVPTYTAAETAAAQRQLCDTYKLAARAVQVDTNGSDKALARIATHQRRRHARQLPQPIRLSTLTHRDAARALAMAYATTTARAHGVATDAECQAALDDVIAKDAVMKKVCGGG